MVSNMLTCVLTWLFNCVKQTGLNWHSWKKLPCPERVLLGLRRKETTTTLGTDTIRKYLFRRCQVCVLRVFRDRLGIQLPLHTFLISCCPTLLFHVFLSCLAGFDGGHKALSFFSISCPSTIIWKLLPPHLVYCTPISPPFSCVFLTSHSESNNSGKDMPLFERHQVSN